MAKSVRVNTKRRGRPKTTGKGELLGVRIHAQQLAALDNWIGQQNDAPSRPEAIRRLLEQALSKSSNPRSPRKGAAEKAAELAGQAIEEATDKSQSAEEQKTRKRRLISGPREFRDIRRDQPRRRS
jgi:hypothetical protein